MFQKIFSVVVSLLYPPVCPVCGKILEKTRRTANPYICPDCYRMLSFPSEPRCLLCSRPLSDEQEAFCPECQKEKKHFDCAVSLMMHDEVSKKILYDLKYYNRRDNARALALEAAHREGRRISDWHPDVIIPVPLHKKRELKRGYNQARLLAEAFSEYLAVSLQYREKTQIPVDSAYLIRMKRTKAQKQLSKSQRKTNIRGAFGIYYREKPDKYAGKTVLLVDDIYTSGATLSECARVLKNHGAKQVYCLTFGLG